MRNIGGKLSFRVALVDVPGDGLRLPIAVPGFGVPLTLKTSLFELFFDSLLILLPFVDGESLKKIQQFHQV